MKFNFIESAGLVSHIANRLEELRLIATSTENKSDTYFTGFFMYSGHETPALSLEMTDYNTTPSTCIFKKTLEISDATTEEDVDNVFNMVENILRKDHDEILAERLKEELAKIQGKLSKLEK